MFGLGHFEWICIFLVILLIFGGKKLPEVARGLGKALREFRKARDELHDAINKEVDGSGNQDSGDGSANIEQPDEEKNADR